MLQTRLAHGYCSRHQAVGACLYAHTCETCCNFVTGTEFTDAIRSRLTDICHLQADA